MSEPQAAAKWLYATLAAHPDVAELVGDRIYEAEAEEEAEYPFVLFSQQTGRDRNAMGADVRLFTTLTYLVKAVTKDPADLAPADAIGRAIDAALQGRNGTAEIDGTTYAIRGCHRTAPHRRIAGSGDTRFNHVGGFYQLTVSDLPS